MLLIEHYVAPSSIHGLGVFAASFVPKETKVWVFHPAIDRLIPVPELEGLPEHVIERIEAHGEYLPHLNAFRLGADGDFYLNHCDEPNLVDRGDEMFACRDIQAGEELHYNYRQTVVIAFDPDTGTRKQTSTLKPA